jgi:D-lactate dehydrogenase
MKIAGYELEDWERTAFEQLSDAHEVVCLTESLSADNASQQSDAEAISTFIYSDLDKSVLEQFENLKLICTRSTGFDHIALDYCQEHDITVCNVPSYGKNTVAEHVFGLLLTISHNLYEAIDRTRKGDFTHHGLQGFDLAGKTLGVIGTGEIGLSAIRIATGIGMEVIAHDVVHHDDQAQRLGFRYVEMDELLASSDVITLHVPGNEKTRHMLSGDEFDKMPDGVVIINTSRGQVIDTEALVRALAEGKVSAAGLDVLPEEPVIREEAEILRSVYRREHDLENLLADHVLMRVRNVVVTPHSAFNTREAVKRIMDTTVDNISSYSAGEAKNVVN